MRFVIVVLLLALPASTLLAQRNRISGTVDNNRRVALRGHVHPRAQIHDDQGPVAPSMPLPYLSLVLKPSVSQEAELNQLLAAQQDPSSPSYHRWLTPEEFADRFGASQNDIDKIVSWLRDQGLTVVSVARARNSVAFRGDAAQVESAFGIKIHHYQLKGARHFANASEPTIPAGFAAVVGSIRGLHDFRFKSPRRIVTHYTSSRGSHYLAPDDVAMIYNIRSLYGAGVDGSGQKLAIVGQTQIKPADKRSASHAGSGHNRSRDCFGRPG